MSFDLGRLETDPKLEMHGSWTEDLGGFKLLIARDNNPLAVAEMKRIAKERAGALGLAEITDEMKQDIIVAVTAKCYLLGWEGLEEDGKPLTYSVEQATRLLKKYPHFLRIVQGQAARLDLFRAKKTEQAAGNSQDVSSGS